MASAFTIRAGEDRLSVNWLEYFGASAGTSGVGETTGGVGETTGGVGETTGGIAETTEAAVSRVRATLRSRGFGLRPNGRFALLHVGTVKTVVRRAFGRSLHINHLPVPDDASHAGIFGYSEEDLMIAAEIRATVRVEDVRDAV